MSYSDPTMHQPSTSGWVKSGEQPGEFVLIEQERKRLGFELLTVLCEQCVYVFFASPQTVQQPSL